MAACPTREELRRFLNDPLPARNDDPVLAHLDTCVACQQVLEDLTADIELQDRLRPAPADPADFPAPPDP